MKKILAVLPAVLLLVAAAPASAQSPAPSPAAMMAAMNGEVSGTVVETQSGTPIPRASVSVRRKRDSVLVAGAIASDKGAFRIQGLRPGTYILRITTIGFKPSLQEFVIADASTKVAIGPVKLTQVAVNLQSVQVATDRSAVTIEPDRTTYRAKDVAPTAATAVDVLEATPSVMVDGEGKISLRGNENVAVQINGRPAPMNGTQLTAFLKGLPASIVERIEVVPNPSARYDPDGMAGILNIVLKTNTDLGVSGSLNGGMANSQRYNGSGNLGYQSGPLTLFSSYGRNSDDRGMFGINNRERFATSSLLSATDQDITEQSGNGGQNAYLSGDYKVNSRDVLSNGLTLNYRNATDGMTTDYSELNSSRAVTGRYFRLRDDVAKGNTLDYTASWKRTLVPRKHEISAEVRYNRAKDTDFTGQWLQPLTLAGAVTGTPILGENNNLSSLTRLVSGQLDYTRALAARTKLETGYKGTARRLDRDYVALTDAAGTGTWSPSSLSNNFTFDETVHAAYAVLSQGVRKFELQGGLRAERADRNFSLASPATTYPYTYTSLFPSAVALYNKSDATSFKMSYSRRIRRPGSQELNPFPTFFDAQNVFFGNPRLNPEYTDAIEGGITHSGQYGSVQFSPFYRHTNNVIRVVINPADTVLGREVTSISFQNLAHSNSYGTDLNGTLKFGTKLSLLTGVNVFKLVTDGGSTSSLSSDAVAISYRANATTNINPTLLLQGSYFYRAPMNFERGKFTAIQQTSFSVRQKVRGDAAAVSLRVQDPFNTGAFGAIVTDNGITQHTTRNFGMRAAFLTFQYNFGQAPKIRQRPDQPTDNRPGFPSGG